MEQSPRLTDVDREALRELGWNLSNERSKRFAVRHENILPIAEELVENGTAVSLPQP